MRVAWNPECGPEAVNDTMQQDMNDSTYLSSNQTASPSRVQMSRPTYDNSWPGGCHRELILEWEAF